MHEDSQQPNQSAIEMRLKQVTRYVTLGLLGVLALCALLFMYIGSVKQSEAEARQTSQAQADLTKDSSYCSVYPNEEICVLSRKIAANPDEVLIPKDGTNGINGEKGDKGDQGERGRGITKFDISKDGDLMVSYTDGQTQNAGRVVGANGKDGKNGLDGKGILSADLEAGNLIIRFTDGTTKNLGIVVGPAGANGTNGVDGKDGESIKGDPGKDGVNGTNGVDGKDGANGTDGVSVIDLQVDSQGYVQVTYSNGTTASAGRVIVNTIKAMVCETDTLTITLMDGQTFSTAVDCTPDASPIPPASNNPNPAAPAAPAANPSLIP